GRTTSATRTKSSHTCPIPRSPVVTDAVSPKMSNVTGMPSGRSRSFSSATWARTASRCVCPGRWAGKIAVAMRSCGSSGKHIVELDFLEPHADRLCRQLGRVDPHRIVVGIDPRDVDPVAPQAPGVALLDRPGRLALGQE